MNYSEEEKELLDKFEKQIKKEKEIVNLFNSLREAIFKDYFVKLEIHEDEKLVIFELVTRCLDYLEQTVNENENYDSLFAINVFKALFIDKNTFKMDDLDQKKDCFNLVLKSFSDKGLTDAEEQKIIEGIKKHDIFDEISKDFEENYYYVYCLSLIFEYSASKLFFLDTFISFMKKMYKDEKDIELDIKKDKNISDSELDRIAPNDLLKSLQDIYYYEENYYELYINENQLQKRDISLDELLKKINENPKPVVKSKKRKKKTKKVKGNLLENQIQEGNKVQEENKIQEGNKIQEENKNVIKRVENFIIINSVKNKNQEDAQKIKENQKSLQKNDKIEAKIQNVGNYSKESSFQEQYDKLSSKLNELMSKIDELSEENEMKTNKINELTSQINVLNKNDEIKTNKINELTSQINVLNKNDEIKTNKINELDKNDKNKENQIKEMKANIKKSKTIIKNTKNNFEKLTKDSIKIENELKSIKLRDVFRNIIDLFCKAYQISLDYNYITKFVEIKIKISKQPIKEDEKINLINFFEKIYFKYQFGNKNAHTIDLSQSIIDQVFAYIDPKNELGNVKIKFDKGNMNSLLKKNAFNRLNNFNDKIKFQKEEEKIFDSVSKISDLYPNA